MLVWLQNLSHLVRHSSSSMKLNENFHVSKYHLTTFSFPSEANLNRAQKVAELNFVTSNFLDSLIKNQFALLQGIIFTLKSLQI